MLRRGANVNFRNMECGRTALIAAGSNSHNKVVRALLNHEGVDVNVKDNDGYTALITASCFATIIRAIHIHPWVFQ